MRQHDPVAAGDWRDVKRSPSVPAMKSHEENHVRTVPGRCQVQREEILGSESFQVHGDYRHTARAEMASSVCCTPPGFLLSNSSYPQTWSLLLPSITQAPAHRSPARRRLGYLHTPDCSFSYSPSCTCFFCLLLCHPPLCYNVSHTEDSEPELA